MSPPVLPWVYKINIILKLPEIAPENKQNKIGPRTP